jgi:hypothetical protein
VAVRITPSLSDMACIDFIMRVAEELRLISYKDWPVTFLDPKHMALAGLYYTWYTDLACCPFCNVVMGGWRPGDNPLERHKRLSPSCSFITQHVAEGACDYTAL